MSSETTAAITAWIGAAVSVVAAGLSVASSKRDKNRFERELEPQIRAEYKPSSTAPVITFHNDGPESYGPVDIVLDKLRTDADTFDSFPSGLTHTIYSFPKQTSEDIHLASVERKPGAAYFLVVCESKTGTRSTRIKCDIVYPPSVRIRYLGPLSG